MEQRITVMKLQETVDRLVRVSLLPVRSGDGPPIDQPDPTPPKALNVGERKERKHQKKKQRRDPAPLHGEGNDVTSASQKVPPKGAQGGTTSGGRGQPPGKNKATKRNRETANMSDTFELSASEEISMDTATNEAEVSGEAEEAPPSCKDGPGEEAAEAAKRRKRPPVKLCTGTSGAKDSGLEFVAREPLFHAIYVDGMSSKTTAGQVLQWFKNRGVHPFAVWKLKKKGADSGFCVGLRPRHLRACSNPDFYPQEMRYRRWVGRPPSPATVMHHVEDKRSDDGEKPKD